MGQKESVNQDGNIERLPDVINFSTRFLNNAAKVLDMCMEDYENIEEWERQIVEKREDMRDDQINDYLRIVYPNYGQEYLKLVEVRKKYKDLDYDSKKVSSIKKQDTLKRAWIMTGDDYYYDKLSAKNVDELKERFAPQEE